MVRALACLSLALASAVAAAALRAEGDAAALLQVSAALGQDDACKCLSWKEVYQKNSVECGWGPELDYAGGFKAKVYEGEEFCTNFYEQISGNFCTNLYYGQQRTEQWCYVSSACKALNGGGSVGDFKWKQCEPKGDAMLGTMDPEALHKVAEVENKDAALLMKMAYPLYNRSKLQWATAKACLLGMHVSDGASCQTVKDLQEAGTPIVIDSKNGHPPFGVVIGKKAYQSQMTKWYLINYAKRGNNWTSSLGKWNEYTCVVGCDQ